MNSDINKTLDDLVNQFHQYGLNKYKGDDKKRNEIIHLYNMKEYVKNGTKDEDGKIPTEEDIMHCIYYLRWQRILPF